MLYSLALQTSKDYELICIDTYAPPLSRSCRTRFWPQLPLASEPLVCAVAPYPAISSWCAPVRVFGLVFRLAHERGDRVVKLARKLGINLRLIRGEKKKTRGLPVLRGVGLSAR
jgi:hypothetical protein